MKNKSWAGEFSFLFSLPAHIILKMESKEFNLSEKIYNNIIRDVHVKQFIKLLKEELDELVCPDLLDRQRKNRIIDKLAGPKLI